MFSEVGADDPTYGGLEEDDQYEGNGMRGNGGSGGGGGGGGGRRRGRGGPGGPGTGQPAPPSDPDKPGSSFFDRIARGNNLTKMGSNSNPRDVAMQVAAQARACVDCPTLQVVGPQSTNQALKAIAIARTFLKESGSTDICVQPEFMQLDDGHTGILLHIRKKFRRTTGEAEAQQLKAASSTDAKVRARRNAYACTRARARARRTPSVRTRRAGLGVLRGGGSQVAVHALGLRPI